jgi:thiazole tautomerase (transcriptional regulator TenI)
MFGTTRQKGRSTLSLHLLSNGKLSFKEFTEIAVKVNPFVDYYHIREKQKTARDLFEGIEFLIQAGIPAKKIIVNDRIDVAVASGLYGVQLAYHSLPTWIVREKYPSMTIGCSTHSLEEVQDAERGGASFAMFGHIYSSSSKPGLEARGCKQLREISLSTSIPIISIGGITPQNVKEVLEHGASGVAVMSGVLDHSDPQAAAEQYKLAITKWEESKHEKTL